MPIMSRPGHRDRDNKYEPMNPRRAPIILTSDDVAQGKESYWSELEITGKSIIDVSILMFLTFVFCFRTRKKPKSATMVIHSFNWIVSQRQ